MPANPAYLPVRHPATLTAETSMASGHGGSAQVGGRDSSRGRAGRPERPLDPRESPVAAFACALRELRAAAGSPSYRELARRALFAPSVLSTAASGATFPTLAVTLAFASACGGDAGQWRRRWEAAAAAQAPLTDAASRPASPRRADAEPAAASSPRRSGSAAPHPTRPGLPAPAELPGTPAHYTGRQAELAHLLALTQPGIPSRAAAVAISGPVGVGKTALALNFAQHAAPHYADGQLHADLASSRANGESAHDVTGRFLSALGVPDAQVPADRQRRTGLYRSVLAAMRVLIVLDNAGSEADVRPLLAAGSSSLVVVTSRHRLAGLDNVRRITLDVLRPGESRALVAAVAGERRTAGAGGAVGKLGELCGHLPLAVWIVAARIADHGGWTACDVGASLRRAGGLLDWLDIGDVSVRSCLRSAYRQLDPPARRAFRRLGSTASGEVHAAHMADLLALPAFAAERLLETLVDAGLLQVSDTTAGYRVPALFASFARELLIKKEPATARRPSHLAAALPITKARLACG